jgi:hypothetical protein
LQAGILPGQGRYIRRGKAAPGRDLPPGKPLPAVYAQGHAEFFQRCAALHGFVRSDADILKQDGKQDAPQGFNDFALVAFSGNNVPDGFMHDAIQRHNVHH